MGIPWLGPPLLSLLLAPLPGAAAQERVPEARPGDTVRVVPGALYAAGSFHEWLFGAHYRAVWTTPVRVPVLDLSRFAGGLTPVGAHTGSQTTSLRLKGADGRTYQFRSVFKRPTRRLPPRLQNSVVANMIQDGASASHPYGALVVDRLLSAVGVLHPEPHLFVMPDDPRLGQFRSEFAGLLGILEERPNEADDEGRGGFGRALKVIGPERLFERIDRGSEDRVDARAFLVSRLMDILIGDRDRHRDNWRWALLDDRGPVRWWIPVSRDHDEAFVRADGALIHVAKLYYPQLVSFGPEYDRTLNLNWHAREVDRRFLAGLDRTAWDSAATFVRARLSDRVILDAVEALPPEIFALQGEWFASALRARRDALGEEARRYYELLAREVDLRGTDDAEVAVVRRTGPHTVDVLIRPREGRLPPLVSRRFDDRETHELRINLWGGADSAFVGGSGRAGTRIRVIGGHGRDELVDGSLHGRVRFYDSGRHTRSVLGPGSTLDRRRFEEWVGSDLDRYPPRDWGSWTRPFPWLFTTADVGVFTGLEVAHTRYGFRAFPYRTDLRLRAGWASEAGAAKVAFEGAFRRENSDVSVRVQGHASGIEILKYFGQGNATTRTGPEDFFKVDFDDLAAELDVVFEPRSGLELHAGPAVRYSSTEVEPGRFIASIADTLYGAGAFGSIAGVVGFEYSGGDRSGVPWRGWRVSAETRAHPGVWSADRGFVTLDWEGRVYAGRTDSVHVSPTLALRLGGRSTWGTIPFQELASIGGRENLRGWDTNRFTGRHAVWAGAEVRWPLGGFSFMLPSDFGFFASADVGRVVVDGASPGGWHLGTGGGVWIAPAAPGNTLSVGYLRGGERGAWYAGYGFAF
ncbi:MAG: hypothetical protein D6701_06450 [Gemmatimonadetes bacterium]|nr:MAG: hypothetical protein D6701_06450 [Gemmatimonadota bacterium]